HQTSGDADPNRKFFPLGPERLRSQTERQAGPHGSLGVIFVRLWVAEIDQHAVAHVLGDKAIEMGDRFGDATVIPADHLAHVLWIKPRRERRRTDQITKHHRELSTL